MPFLAAAIALISSLLLTPVVRSLARRFDIVDHPDGRNKTHSTPKPLGGGVVIFAATSVGAGAATYADSLSSTRAETDGSFLPLLAAAFVMLLVGLVDDKFVLRGRQKLFGQLASVAIVIAAGLRIENIALFDAQFELGSLAVPFTVLWVLGAVNSVNLLDGADGFASVIGLVIAGTLGVIALILGQVQDSIVALALAASLGGFLVFNFPPSNMFLGDAGSLVVGLVLGVLSVQGHLKGPATVVFATPVALLLIPILDSTAAIVRRWLSGKSLSTGDRQHLHHVLQRRGFGPRGIVLVGGLLCSISSIAALATVVTGLESYAVLGIVLVLLIVWANDLFGYTEVRLVRSKIDESLQSLLPGAMRRPRSFQTRIGSGDTPEVKHVWRKLRAFVSEHNLSRLRLELGPSRDGGEPIHWEHRLRHHTENWGTRIPLAVEGRRLGQVELSGTLDSGQVACLLDDLVGLIEWLNAECDTMNLGIRSDAGDSPHPRKALHFDRAEIVGVKFDFISQDRVIDAIEHWRCLGQRNYITLTNPHSVMLCRRDNVMREATARSGLTLPDGVGCVLAAKLLGYGRRHRVTGPALMLALCDQGREYGYRHFFCGGGEGIADKLAQEMCRRFPGLAVAGTYCPPFGRTTAEEDERTVELINRSSPDIVWVGLGAPKQEKWMLDHQLCIRCTAMIGVGAAFDFHTGNVKWAPWVFRRTGTEWAYRLALEPRRMWRRNLDSPLFLLAAIAQLARRVRRSITGKRSFARIRCVTWDSRDGASPNSNRRQGAHAVSSELHPQTVGHRSDA